jgi:hypothetical protein
LGPILVILLAMLVQEILLENIDFEDERFRISEELESVPLLDSLREIEQLNPILLLERNSRKAIVCGFRRVHAMLRLGTTRALARIIPENSCSQARVFEFALRDNLSHRRLDPLEKARVLFSLRNHFAVLERDLVQVYLPMLGLNPHEGILRRYLLIHGIQPALRSCLKDGRLTHSSVEAIAEMPDSVQESISILMGKARLSASLQKKLLGLLDDLAGTTGNPSPLDSPEVSEILNDPRLSPFQRGEKVYELLYRLQYPRFSAALDRFEVQKKVLCLPGSIRITAHPFFEQPGLHVEFDAPDIERFRHLASALRDAAQLPESEELFIVR